MLLAMDPPRHSAVRRPIAPHFQARVISDLEERIRGICREILRRAANMEDVEFVHDVTSGLPSQVIGELMGLPREDWGRIHAMAERITQAQDPDVSGGDPAMAATTSVEMAMYAIDFAGKRRAQSRADLTDVILGMEIDGTPVSDVDFGTLFVQLVTAANDTTKTMLSSGLLALLQHPEQMAAVRSDSSLVPSAVEEILRWASPVLHFRRTATRDVELGGETIRAGDKVVTWYISANRDETAFPDPYRFDIGRTPNEHVTFGPGGPHFCLGAHLARQEITVMFRELLGRVPGIHATGEPERLLSNFINGIKHLPVAVA
jgi:cytochrome P450